MFINFSYFKTNHSFILNEKVFYNKMFRLRFTFLNDFATIDYKNLIVAYNTLGEPTRLRLNVRSKPFEPEMGNASVGKWWSLFEMDIEDEPAL
jgi:hypothetical protein